MTASDAARFPLGVSLYASGRGEAACVPHVPTSMSFAENESRVTVLLSVTGGMRG